MLHTKFKGHQPFGSREEDFFKVSTIYGHGCHLGHVTLTIWINVCSPIPWRLHMKFDFDWPSGFWGEDVWRVDDRRQRPIYPISLQWAPLSWANKIWISFLWNSSKYECNESWTKLTKWHRLLCTWPIVFTLWWRSEKQNLFLKYFHFQCNTLMNR